MPKYCESINFFDNKIRKTKIIDSLPKTSNCLQYANRVDKKHEKKFGTSFAKKC